MILVMGHMQFAAGEGAKLAPLLAAHMQAVAAEEGCEHYTFSLDPTNPDLVRVAERWASPEALAAHGVQPHQKAFGRSLREFTMESISIKAWEGEHWRTLIGD